MRYKMPIKGFAININYSLWAFLNINRITAVVHSVLIGVFIILWKVLWI